MKSKKFFNRETIPFFRNASHSSYGSLNDSPSTPQYTTPEISQLAQELFDNYFKQYKLLEENKARELRNAETERLLHNFLQHYFVHDKNKLKDDLEIEISKVCSQFSTLSSPILKYINNILAQVPLTTHARGFNNTK